MACFCVSVSEEEKEREKLSGGLKWPAPWERTAAILVEFSM